MDKIEVLDVKYKDRLIRHIKALDNAYENIIAVLEEDIKVTKKEGEADQIALKDDKIKSYADGLEKATKTANYLLEEIKLKQEELDKILNPETVIPQTKDGNSKLTDKLT